MDQWPPTPGFWYFGITGKHGAANTVWVADERTSATVELSAVAQAFIGSNPEVVIQNITLEKFAQSYGSGAIWAYGDNWQILNNWVEHNHYTGVSENGSNGSQPHNWLVEYNEFYQNGNSEMGGPTINSMWQNNQLDQNGEVSYCNDSGQKVQGTNPTVSGNSVNNTNGIGLWFDDGTQNGMMSGNTITGGIGEGIRCEISHYCKFTGSIVCAKLVVVVILLMLSTTL